MAFDSTKPRSQQVGIGGEIDQTFQETPTSPAKTGEINPT